MDQIIACRSCATKLKVRPEYAGRKVRCPKCNTVLDVPAPALEAEVVEEVPPQDAIRTPQVGPEPRAPLPPAPLDERDFDLARPHKPLPKLGSLAQAARTRQLRIARIILAIIGIITLAMAIYQVAGARDIAQRLIQKEIEKRGWLIFDVEAVVRAVRLQGFINLGLASLYILFAFIVYRFPVPVTVVGLVMYVGVHIINAVRDPHTIYQGLILKILIIVGLAKAVQAAITYQKERAAERRRRDEEEEYEPSSA